MVWTKTATYTPTSKLDFAGWLFGTALPLGGWSLEGTVDVTGARYYYIKKTVTLANGDTQNHCLCYEYEYNDDDLMTYAWNGTGQTTGATDITLMGSDTTWFAGKDEYGMATVWQETGTDAFVIYRDHRVFAFGLTSAGYLATQMNTSVYAASRPIYSLCPVADFSMASAAIKNADLADCKGGGAQVENASADVYENRAWMHLLEEGVASEWSLIFWQDPSNTWKQTAYSTNYFTQSVSVAQIGTEYYLNVGPWLLPVGTSEPAL